MTPIRVPLVQLGLGQVGRALVGLVRANRARHAGRVGVRLEYVALADRDGLLAREEGFPDDELAEIARAKAQGARLRDLKDGHPWNSEASLLELCPGERTIVIDVTATDQTVPVLREACRRGLGIVLANKLPLTGSYALFRELTASRRTRFETTVGAALPVIATLQALLDTGDAIHRIRGRLSGTLNFLCEALEQGKRFSQAVREARARGFTEPDPREDLAGRDAARKGLILARLLGHPLEFEDIAIEPLYPPEMDTLPPEDFLHRLEALDDLYAEQTRQAHQEGRALRYAVEVAEGRCAVGLRALVPDDDLLRPRASDSVVVFETARYAKNPLMVSGRGAGPEPTASGVLSDILQLL